MLRFILRRLLISIPVLFGIIFLVFALARLLPGDPCIAALGERATEAICNAFNERYGLNESVPVQFVRYLGEILPFVGGDGVNFGYSFQSNTEVLPQILNRLPATMFLTAGAVVLWLSIAIPIGVISAVRTGSWLDRATMGLALIAISAPVYFLGLVALFLFDDSIGRFPLLPGSGAYGDADSFFGKAAALIMPWCVLAAAFAAIYARFLRGNLIDTMQEDYIRTARAKGLSERRVIFRHGVRSAITPIVTLLGLDIGILLGGAILTETVFNIPGIGRYAYDAIVRFDLPVIQGTVLFGAFFIVTMSLVVDILYAFIDPRVRY